MNLDWNQEPPLELNVEQTAFLAKLTPNQREVLANLAWWGTNWVRPMDVGGRNGTHHSATLRALVAKGIVESRWRTGPGGKWARGSKTYRLTLPGLLIAKACDAERDGRILDRMAAVGQGMRRPIESRANAVFECGAAIYGGEGMRPDFACGETLTVPLFNDGQYTNFVAPEGWHIELGYDPRTDVARVVRCPQHCVWVGSVAHSDTGEEIPAHWEDLG